MEEEATASDVADFPLARSRQYTQGREGLRRDFDPVARPQMAKTSLRAGCGVLDVRAVWPPTFECPNGYEPLYGTYHAPSSSSMRPPEPAEPPRTRVVEQTPEPAETSHQGGSANVEIPMNPLEVELERRPAGGQRRRKVKDKYVEVDGMLHTKTTSLQRRHG